MIDSGQIALEYVKKEDFFGSYRGMRYRLSKQQIKMLEKEEEVTKDILEVIIWPEPYNFFKTPSEKKQRKEFVFSADGKEEAVIWLNEQYDKQKPLWEDSLC